jgi:hypothetical protein
VFEPKEPMVPERLYTDLLAKYHALKLAGASEPRQPTKRDVIPPAPDETELALEASKREWVENLTASMTAQRVPERQAREWAERQVAQMAHNLVAP